MYFVNMSLCIQTNVAMLAVLKTTMPMPFFIILLMPRVSKNKLYMGNSVWSEHLSSDLKVSSIKVMLKVKNKKKN